MELVSQNKQEMESSISVSNTMVRAFSGSFFAPAARLIQSLGRMGDFWHCSSASFQSNPTDVFGVKNNVRLVKLSDIKEYVYNLNY